MPVLANSVLLYKIKRIVLNSVNNAQNCKKFYLSDIFVDIRLFIDIKSDYNQLFLSSDGKEAGL
jgi:hypothetical protein